MEYRLNVRAFVDIKRKEKAEAYAARLLPGMSLRNVGRYWKNEDQWEFQIHHEFDSLDDSNAVWETLSLFRSVVPCTITVGPNDSEHEIVIAGIGHNQDGTGLTWCGFELSRITDQH